MKLDARGRRRRLAFYLDDLRRLAGLILRAARDGFPKDR